MRKLVSALMDSPFYFTMALRERYELIKRLEAGESKINLSHYWQKVQEVLEKEPTF